MRMSFYEAVVMVHTSNHFICDSSIATFGTMERKIDGRMSEREKLFKAKKKRAFLSFCHWRQRRFRLKSTELCYYRCMPWKPYSMSTRPRHRYIFYDLTENLPHVIFLPICLLIWVNFLFCFVFFLSLTWPPYLSAYFVAFPSNSSFYFMKRKKKNMELPQSIWAYVHFVKWNRLNFIC